jgi:hypothetical protein
MPPETAGLFFPLWELNFTPNRRFVEARQFEDMFAGVAVFQARTRERRNFYRFRLWCHQCSSGWYGVIMVIRGHGILLLLACIPLPMSGQTRFVRGSVTDEHGAPLRDVSIEFAADVGASYPQSDGEGRFRFAIAANSVIFRRAGFVSKRVSLSDLTDLRVILRRAPFASLPICTANQACTYNQTYESALCFVQVAGIQVGPLQPGIDSVGRDFFSDGQNMHVHSGNEGRNNLTGDSKLWDSSEFSENVYLVHQKSLLLREQRAIDARGRTPDGKYWRYLQAAPESVRYAGVDRAIADRFDKLLDDVCERLDLVH